MSVTLAAISLTSPVMLLAAGAVALPIAAHLLNRRARRRVTFPSITLLAEAAAGQSRLFRLRRVILLALRCLAIVLIAYAFAQPVWVERSAVGGPMGDRQAVVVVVDASASAGQRAGGASLFPRVQSAAMNVLDEVRPGRDVANVVVADAQPRAAFDELIPNPQSLRADVRQLEPTAERADLSAAVNLAAAMLADVAAQRRIVVVSDMQATNWDDVDAATLAPGTADRPIELIVVPVGEREPANVGLTAPRVQPAQVMAGRPVELSVEVINHAPTEQTVRVRLTVDGRAEPSETVTLEPWEARRVSFEPMTLDEHAVEASEDDRSRHHIRFSLDGDDALALDNQAYLVVRATQRMSLAVVSDADAADSDGEAYYLHRALTPHGDDRDALVIHDVGGGELDEAALAASEIVVLSDTAPLDEQERQTLHNFVEDGGGLVVTASGDAALDRFDSLGELSPWRGEGRLSLGDAQALRLDDGAWEGDVLGVFDALGRDALGRVSFRRVLSIAETADAADVLLRFDNGEPALARLDVGAGRVVAANFGAAPGESDLAARGIFVPLVHVMLDAARATPDGEPRVTVGESAAGAIAAVAGMSGQDSAEMELRDPEGQPVRGRTRQPGFHTLRGAEGEELEVIAVNVDPRESDLRRVGPGELQQRMDEAEDADGRQLRHAGADVEAMHLSGRPLWPYFVVAALAMLGLELAMLIAWRR